MSRGGKVGPINHTCPCCGGRGKQYRRTFFARLRQVFERQIVSEIDEIDDWAAIIGGNEDTSTGNRSDDGGGQ